MPTKKFWGYSCPAKECFLKGLNKNPPHKYFYTFYFAHDLGSAWEMSSREHGYCSATDGHWQSGGLWLASAELEATYRLGGIPAARKFCYENPDKMYSKSQKSQETNQ